MPEGSHKVFDAVIAARDGASPAIEKVRQSVHKLGEEQEKVARHGGRAFESLSGHVKLLHTHFGNLTAGVGEVGHSLTDFLPALGAFGAAGSMVGLVELTARTAEAAAALQHVATVIGLPVEQLQRLNYVAKMTDTDVGSMQNAMSKLNVAIAKGSKNKEAAALLQHLGIATKDASGHMRSAADLLPELADAFAKTTSPAMRSLMAVTLFSKAGKDMIPMLALGSAEIAKLLAEAGTIGYVLKPGERAGLDQYADSMKKMKAAAEGFADSLGAKLAPVLQPIIDDVTAWIAANREWIATEISGKVKELGDWLRRIDWAGDIKAVSDFAHNTMDLVNSFGGLQTVIGGVALLMGSELLLKVAETAKSMKELSFVAAGPLVEALGEGAYALFTTRDAAFALDYALNANPFGVIIAAAALVGAAAYEIWAHWSWLKARFQGLFEWFDGQNAWVEALIVVTMPLIGLPLLIMQHWQGISAFFGGVWAELKSEFDAAMVWLGPIIDKLTEAGDVIARVLHIPDVHNGTAIAGIASRSVQALPDNGLSDLGTARVTHGRHGGILSPSLLPPVAAPTLVSPYAPSGPTATGTPPAAGPAAPGASPITGRVDVAVRFDGLPPGAQVSTKSSGQVSASVARGGTAWPDTHLAHS